MLELHRIGVFLRDDQQAYPLDAMERLFKRARIEFFPDARTAESLDLVIALGGDGTILRALGRFPGVPVLAVNFGNVGFLTQCSREHLDKVLVRLLSDDYSIEERLSLEVRHKDRAIRCINEAVLRGTSRMVTVDMSFNGRPIHQPRGDGVIVGTPTGSTAYLLSTGAPLVTPDVDCIVVQPLNEYSFSSRTLVVPGSTTIELAALSDGQKGKQDVLLIVDGAVISGVKPNEPITVCRSAVPARLVTFEPDYFFRNLKERLRW